MGPGIDDAKASIAGDAGAVEVASIPALDAAEVFFVGGSRGIYTVCHF